MSLVPFHNHAEFPRHLLSRCLRQLDEPVQRPSVGSAASDSDATSSRSSRTSILPRVTASPDSLICPLLTTSAQLQNSLQDDCTVHGNSASLFPAAKVISGSAVADEPRSFGAAPSGNCRQMDQPSPTRKPSKSFPNGATAYSNPRLG